MGSSQNVVETNRLLGEVFRYRRCDSSLAIPPWIAEQEAILMLAPVTKRILRSTKQAMAGTTDDGD